MAITMSILKYATFLAMALVALAACAPDAPERAADAAPESADASRPEVLEPKYAETTKLIDLVERAVALVKSQGQEEACAEF